jgi:hypothetical protein
MGTEVSWQDVGGLTYSFSGPSGPCTIKSAKLSDGTAVTPTTMNMMGKSASVVVDPALDAAPSATNFIEITADTSGCGAGASVGQWSVSAMDKGKNSTHFKWQKGGTPQNPNPIGGTPTNPNPIGGVPTNPNPNGGTPQNPIGGTPQNPNPIGGVPTNPISGTPTNPPNPPNPPQP